MRRTVLCYIFISLFIASCSKDEDNSQQNDNNAAAPVACFTVNKYVTVDSTEVFSFTNCSQNAVRYEWDFGDADYAPVANPMHIYNQYGKFIVRMTAYNSNNVASTVFDTITVGYYSLYKIVFKQASTRFSTPILRMLRTSYFDIRDTLFSQSMLPLTVQLTDSSVYDINSASVQYIYREDSIGQPTHNARAFIVTPASIINSQFDTAFNFGVWDTANFTMYYKIAYY